MISWIQNLLERKGRVVFIILLGVIIVAFVFVIGETPGCVSNAPGTQERNYYGYNLNSEREMRLLASEAIISSIVTRGQRPQSDQQINQEILSRAALLYLADAANIPQPSQATLLQYLSGIPFFQNDQGNFDPNRLNNFLDMTQLSRQFDQATIDRTFNNDFRIQQLMESIAAPGYTLPYDIEKQTRRMNATYDLSTAILPEELVEFTFEPTEEQIETFFSQRVEAYRIPETRMLAQISFTPEAYAAEMPEPSEVEVQEFFDNNRTLYLDEEAEDPSKALPQLENVREQVVADLKQQQAEMTARQRSENFVYALFDQEIEMNDPRIQDMISSLGATETVLEPMVGTTPPGDSTLPARAWSEAARLDSIRYFSDPIETEDGVEVILLRDVIPSTLPELSQVREEVLADLKKEQMQEALVAYGEQIRAKISAKVAEGSSFAQAAGDLGLQVQSFTGAGWEDLPEGLAPATLQRAETLPDGEVSPMVVTDSGGSFLFVESRGAPAYTPEAEQYQQTRDFLASGNSRRFVSSFLSDLVQNGLARADAGLNR